jgi:hypothetical protein
MTAKRLIVFAVILPSELASAGQSKEKQFHVAFSGKSQE